MTTITQRMVFYGSHIQYLPRYFCFESQSCFVFDNDTQRHANKGAKQTKVHRLICLEIQESRKEDKNSIPTMHWTKSYYHGFFKYGAISKSQQAAKCRIYSESDWLQETIGTVGIVLVISYHRSLFPMLVG